MALPVPRPGLLINYSYLWHREARNGQEEGRKDRPCAIVAAIRSDETGETRVLVLPVTYAAPSSEADDAVEIPDPVKRRLQLDDKRSWVVISEWNEFTWPGYDLRRIRGAADAPLDYGMLPPTLFTLIQRRFLRRVQGGAVAPVQRT